MERSRGEEGKIDSKKVDCVILSPLRRVEGGKEQIIGTFLN
jgi:hypothetical protein